MEGENKELDFREALLNYVDSFGEKNQDGIKATLRECQDLFSYVSIAHQREIAQAFKVDEKIVKTLIKLSPSIKESKVEYEIICCSGSRCAKNGSFEVLKTISESLGISFDEISSDGRIRLTTQNCFKKCGEGPNIMINGKFYHHLNKEVARDLMLEIKNSK